MIIPYILAIACVDISLLTAILRVLKFRRQSFATKCIACVLFMLTAVLAMSHRAAPLGRPATFLFIGLALGVIGDVFLGLAPLVKKKRESPYMSLGGVTFFVGHLFFIAALLGDIPLRLPLLALLPVVPLLLLVLHKAKVLDLGKRMLPIVGYGLVLGAMMLASFNYALHLAQEPLNELPIAILMWLPGILFVISDSSLFLRNFGNEKVKRCVPVLEFTVMLPYFAAQSIFALAVAVV